MEGSHYPGIVIKRYRERKGWTQKELGEKWPNEPVEANYIGKIERGLKNITDQMILRQIADLLDIPLWEFGLSDYNPFSPNNLPGKGVRVFNETLDVIDDLIHTIWFMRRVAPVPTTLQKIQNLISMFELLRTNSPPPSREQGRFLSLYAQTKCLDAIMSIEHKDYSKALATYLEMEQIAKESGDPGTITLALIGVGTELERAGNQQEAVDYLESARDASFNASRQIAGLANAYLARAYSSIGNIQKFERVIDVAEGIAANLGDRYGDGTDYVFHRMSGILAERSYGYLETSQPRKVLELRERIENQITTNENMWLHAWIPLDWARAYFMIGEIEESVALGIEFYRRATLIQSPHAIIQAFILLDKMEQAGYKDEPSVKQFRDILYSTPVVKKGV